MAPLRIRVIGQHDGFTGWGLHAWQVVRELSDFCHVSFRSIRTDDGACPLPSMPSDSEQVVDINLQVTSIESGVIPGAIVWTMHESSQITAAMVDNLNKAKLVIVPCEWNAKGFKHSGVKAPICIAQLGYSPAAFFRQEIRAINPCFTFGIGGSINGAGERKQIQAVVDTFHQTEINAQLQVKVMPWESLNTHGDARIVVMSTFMHEVLLGAWYRGLDCFVTASRGEGVGLMPMQAMACGCHVIAPVYGGHAAYMGQSVTPVRYWVDEAGGFYRHEGMGQQCFPDMNHLGRLMTQMADGSPMLRLPTRTQVADSVAHLTWKNSVARVRNILHEFTCQS